MPRFKAVHKGLKLLPIDFDKQLLPGTFEHALGHLVDHELDLSDFHSRYRSSLEGAAAYEPAVPLTIVLLTYSRGIISSRRMEAALHHARPVRFQHGRTGRQAVRPGACGL